MNCFSGPAYKAGKRYPGSRGLAGLLGGWAGQGVGGQFQANSHWSFQPLEEDASAASASSTWVGSQFQANSHWSFQPLGEDASAVSASSAWVAASLVVWVGEMQGGDSPSPLLVSQVPGLRLIFQCRDLWKQREVGLESS